MSLTKRQKQILNFIAVFKKRRDISPSLEEIKKHLKLSSVATIHYHVKGLENAGYLKKEKNQPRTIDVYDAEKMVNIPLLGLIAAGRPIEAIQNKETIAVPQHKLPRIGKCYALRVKGESMIGENIDDGDIILVKKQSVAENGQKVVALIDGYEATLKKFYKGKNFYRLQPSNSRMPPIIVSKTTRVDIQGIVIGVVKSGGSLQAEEAVPFTVAKREKTLPLNKVILGDAIAELKKLPDESCDVVIVDPPYNIGKDFGNNIDKREIGEYVSWCKNWINESIRVMKPTGTMFIYGFSEILAHLSVEMPVNKRWLIWHYTNKNVASLNFWQRSHESIICAWKNKPLFNRDDVREPYTEGFLRGAAGKIRKGTIGRYSKGGKETIYNAHAGGALPRDVIKIPALAGGAGLVERWFLCRTCNDVFHPQDLKKHLSHETVKHPTQKPLELSKRLIKSAAPRKGGVVLVPFVGTGSECVAAKELGQDYIGFEINPEYVRIAEKTLQSVEPEACLF